MNNYLEILNLKQKCMHYHEQQIETCLQDLNHENIHILIAESSAFMAMLLSCVEIATACSNKQSPVDVNTYRKTLDESLISELRYLEQCVNVSRSDNLFLISNQLEVEIKPLRVKRRMDYTGTRKLIPFLQEIKITAGRYVQDLMDIYTESSVHFDQSWRVLDIHRSHYTCRECGAMVTEILSHVGNLSSISLAKKESYLPRLTYVYGREIKTADLLPWGGVNQITDDEVLVHTDSLYMDVKKQPAGGCCGSDSSAFNIFCRNGHPVGKEAADCWMPHFIRMPLDRVIRYELM